MIKIKKRVSLDFIGEEYKDSYLVFNSIAVKEYEGLQKSIKAIEGDDEKALPFITEQLKSRFIEGKVDGQAVTADDLEDLPGDVFIECFNQIRGQLDPKAQRNWRRPYIMMVRPLIL